MFSGIARGVRAWLARRTAPLLLAVTAAGLAAGGLAELAGGGGAADLAWLAAAACGLGYALWATADSLRRGRLGVDVIALLALGGAVAVGELLAAAVISVMLASGRALETWAAYRARHDLSALLARAPRTGRRYRDGSLETVPLEAIAAGDVLLVAAGEVVPADGTLASGAAVLDESALTGEALPVEHVRGAALRSGTLNAAGPFELRATAAAADSTYAGIIRLVAEAERAQAPSVRLADRYAMWFLPLSLAVAAAAWAAGGPARAVAVLVVATPCPLILAVPVALVSGLSAAARRGVVVKNGGVLERLARCTTLILDKTGTLTAGQPAVTAVVPAGGLAPEEILTLAASLDQVSGHVLAAAVVRAAAGLGCTLAQPAEVTEEPGQGIAGTVAGRRVRLGRAEWAAVTGTPPWLRAVRRRARLDGALTVFAAVDGRPAGALLLEDRIRPDARQTLRAVRRGGITRIVLATGDRAEAADAAGALAGVDEVLAGLAPEDKLDAVRREQRRAPVIMVGDGINDAPALALADVGVAMGARGATASSEAADAVLTVDQLGRLGDVAALARRTRRIALQSVLAGMGMSLAAMGAAAAGLLPAVWGALLQEAIDVAVILNALRALRPPAPAARLSVADAALTSRFRAEHLTIRADIEQVRAAADALTADPAAASAAMARVRRVHALLASEVWPHEHAEEADLYPALDRVLGGTDPTAAMSRAHAEIGYQIARLGRLIDDIGDRVPDETDVTDLRGVLYGLDAILRLHTAQEDEAYLSLGDGTANQVTGG
ncbi:MAG TPA: heavy metal translocating P-type ATPase [Streptosporangiaceae bacterium]|jgi:heavy metal translocating P-type ATPase|nr:heavy metal translocating P-type ATPase [Streptosporangiaceae bacterium]